MTVVAVDQSICCFALLKVLVLPTVLALLLLLPQVLNKDAMPSLFALVSSCGQLFVGVCVAHNNAQPNAGGSNAVECRS